MTSCCRGGRRLRLEAEAKGCRLDLHAPGSPVPSGGARAPAPRRRERRPQRHPPRAGGDRRRDRPGAGWRDRARIVVRDHGPGVPEELLGAIFEPFFRVEGHRSRIDGGIGLGLAIARRAVDLHRGQDHGPQRPSRALGHDRAGVRDGHAPRIV